MADRLRDAPSPYLRQHADNPVHWWPWGEEAFAEARRRDVPVFLSIGYATCHWCHVMAHEVFEDQEAAAWLNEAFVCIKVDREERPDVDDLYMAVCQTMTGSGGWPLSIWITADRKPFYARTYIPKEDRGPHPGMRTLLPAITRAWQERRDELVKQGEHLLAHLSQAPRQEHVRLGRDALGRAAEQVLSRYDATHGGFGRTPKFPSAHNVLLLLRHWHRTQDATTRAAVGHTLSAMAAGGLRDHLGGGFHRYSTDREWLLPHFEKTLYDQAMLAYTYTEAHQALGDPALAGVARQTIDYCLACLQDPKGGFHSGEDADSEGEEGAFYVWKHEEVTAALGSDAEAFCQAYDVRPGGNHSDEATGQPTGKNVLHLPTPAPGGAGGPADRLAPAALAPARKKLHAVREQRERPARPARDDKVLLDWNGLMLAALAKGTTVFGDARYREATNQLLTFLRREMRTEDGRLRHRWHQGRTDDRAYLDDHAYLLWGLVEAYQATFKPACLEWAVEVAARVESAFLQDGAYTLRARDDPEELPGRPPDPYDGALPSGNGTAAWNLARLGLLTGDTRWTDAAQRVVDSLADPAQAQPRATAALHLAADMLQGPTREVLLAGDREGVAPLLRVVADVYHPRQVVLRSREGLPEVAPWTAAMAGDGTAAYVCEGHACKLPARDVEALARVLAG